MKIVLSPDPTLRQVCSPADPTDKGLKHLASQMGKTMYKNNGCGLAAPQVGVLKRIIVIDCNAEEDKKHLEVLLNPVIVAHSDETVECDEGCLSVPGVAFPITRWAWVTVEALDLDGQEIVYEKADGLLGRCLQHEIDHLDGITMFERLDPFTRMGAIREYQEALARGARPGDTSVPE